MKQQYIFPVDTCVACGSVVPEGRQVCPACERQTFISAHNPVSRPAIPPASLGCLIRLLFKKRK